MALPKLNIITHTMNLASTGEEISYRPFLVKEEKVLMMAMQSGDPKDMLKALKEIIKACVNTDIKVNTLPIYDIEYIFLQLRARSIGDKIPITYTLEDVKCKKAEDKLCTFETEINIDDVNVDKPEGHNPIVELTDTIKVKMSYPKIETWAEMSMVMNEKDTVEKTFGIIADSIEYIMDGDEDIHYAKDYSKKEMGEFMNSLSSPQFQLIHKFFDTMPKVRKEVTAKCTVCGEENTKVLEGMADFFA